MSNILDRARDASREQNWSLVIEYLQKLPLAKNRFHTSSQTFTNEETIPDLENLDIQSGLPLALEVLAAGDFQERWEISKLFPAIGQVAIAPLIDILEDEDAELEHRWFAARILANFNSAEVATALGETLSETSVQTTSSSPENFLEMLADALASLGDLAIESLTDLLAKPESRVLATRALGQIHSNDTIQPLLTVIDDKDAGVRQVAIAALSNYRNSAILAVLIEALQDPAAAVRKEAIIGLGVWGDTEAEIDLVKLLQPLLWDIRLQVCQQAAIALGKIGTNEAATALFEFLKSPTVPPALKIEIARYLSWIQTPTALEYLRDLLGCELAVEAADRERIADAIIGGLGKVEKPELKPKAIEILIAYSSTGNSALANPRVKKSLALGFGYLGDKRGLDYLISMLADEDAGVRLYCVAALKQLAGEGAYCRLIDLSQQEDLEPQLKAGVQMAIAEWKN